MRFPRRAFLGLVLILLPTLLAGAQTTPGAAPRAKVGAYYFGGWTGKTYHITDRLKSEFADREPVWGWVDNTPEIMRQQIDLAADGGIDFFAFCWYWPEKGEKDVPMHDAIRLYLDAPNNNRLEFCLLVANHAGYRIGPDDWEAVCAEWIPLLQRPTHLKIDGKPLLIFFSPRELLQSFGTPQRVAEAFESLRERCGAAGLPGVTIAACATPGPEHGWNDLKQLEQAGFDLLTGYNYAGVGAPRSEKQRPFAELIEGSARIWDAFVEKTDLPYVPVVTTGWDKRPWEAVDLPVEKQSVRYADRTPEAVGAFVRRAIDWLDRNPKHTLADRLILLYAWNENGEGGYLTPTRADGASYLDAVRDAVLTPNP